MALPTKTNLETMDYAFQGQPFVNVPAKATIDLATMDYAFQAQPFVGNPAEGAPPPEAQPLPPQPIITWG